MMVIFEIFIGQKYFEIFQVMKPLFYAIFRHL